MPRPHFKFSLRHDEQFHIDGEPLDIMSFPVEINAIFYAYCDALEEAGIERSLSYKALWEKHRNSVSELVKAYAKPEDVKAHVKDKLKPDSNGLNWYRQTVTTPNLATIAANHRQWLKEREAASTPPPEPPRRSVFDSSNRKPPPEDPDWTAEDMDEFLARVDCEAKAKLYERPATKPATASVSSLPAAH